ncbi:MAG: hypothetical protein ACYC6G_20060 [Desulfobaccales bacterium]
MDHLAFISTLEKLAPFGVPGIMAFLWWLSIRSIKEAYAAQTAANVMILAEYQKVLSMYKADLVGMNGQMSEILKDMSKKYDDNVRLVENFGALTQRYTERAESLERLIQINYQCMQAATDAVLNCSTKPGVKL